MDDAILGQRPAARAGRPVEMKPTLATVALERPMPGRIPLIASDQLFRQGNTLRIEHAGQTYQLRVTRENRLILTK